MKLQIPQENLAKALLTSSRFANSKAQLPILGNILFSTQKTKLLIASTNLELSIAQKLSAKVDEEGDITIPSKIISEIISNLNPGLVSLESEKEQLKVSSNNFSSKILGMNSTDFPKVPEKIDKEKCISVKNSDFSKALSQVAFASSTDETRPVITGVLLTLSKDTLNLVATDGFRLSQKKISVKSGIETQVVVPKNTIVEISRIFSDQDDIFIDLKSADTQLLCGGDDLVLSSRLISGSYPNFQKIIPTSSAYKISVNKEDLARAVKLASILARDSANIIKIGINKDKLTIVSESQSAGTQENKVDAKVEGLNEKDSITIAFNYRFVEEFLSSVAGSDVTIKLTDSSSAAIFLDTNDNDYLHLIMPVKLQE